MHSTEQMTHRSVALSIPETRCSTVRQRGTLIICTWRHGGCCSSALRCCSRYTRSSLRNSSLVMIPRKGVGVHRILQIRAGRTEPSIVFHASELSLLFGPVPNPVEDDFANQMTDFFLNFVHDLSPGGEDLQLCYYDFLTRARLQLAGQGTRRRPRKCYSSNETTSP